MAISRRLTFTLLLLAGCTRWAVAEEEYVLLEIDPGHELHKREASDAEYVDLLHELHEDIHPEERRAELTRRSPQDQYQQYQASNAYDLHQARLRASLSGQTPSVQTFGGTDEALQRQAAINAQEAAKTFRSSYRQRQPAQVRQLQQQQPAPVRQIQQQPTQIRQLQPTYAPETAPQQQYLVETSSQPQQPVAQNYFSAYNPTTRLQDTSNQATLQAYQQQANQAEQAAISFQRSLQQGSRTGVRPRLSQPQYILEQQHSYVVPDTTVVPEVATDVPTEQYNLAALQQAYQQIENANQKAVAEIQQRQPVLRQRQRFQQQQQQQPQPLPTPTYQEDDASSIGGGDGFEFVKQTVPTATRQQIIPQQPIKFEPETVYEPVTPKVKTVPRTRQRTRVQTTPQPITQYEVVTTEAPIQYTAAPVQQYRQPVEQPQQYRQPAEQPQQYTRIVEQPTVAPQYSREQPTRQYTKTVTIEQPQYTRVEQPSLAQLTRLTQTEQPQYTSAEQLALQQYRILEQASQQQQYSKPAEPARKTVQRQRPTEQPKTAVIPQYTRPVTTEAVPAAPAATQAKIGNIDINLLRSLYTAAEALAKKQKEEVSPVTEDDFVKALLEQGRREQQAAEIIQNAAKSAPPAPTDKEIDVVHIPKTTNQRPITIDELDALIKAGYDVRPIGEPKVVPESDPIRQQYLRQADFLEKQAALRSIRQQASRQ